MTMLVIAGFIFTTLFLVTWWTHVHMTIDDTEVHRWGWGNWTDFRREFQKHNWYRSESFRYSFFAHEPNQPCYNDTAYIHAGIIWFDHKGMVLYPWTYALFLLWQLQNRNNKRRKSYVNWSEE